MDSWGTFGDDSTSIEDAPTQGRMFLRVDDGRSEALWGNFKLNLGTDNTLAQVNRGLYGLHGRYVAEDATAFGDARAAHRGVSRPSPAPWLPTRTFAAPAVRCTTFETRT